MSKYTFAGSRDATKILRISISDYNLDNRGKIYIVIQCQGMMTTEGHTQYFDILEHRLGAICRQSSQKVDGSMSRAVEPDDTISIIVTIRPNN